MHGTDDWLPPLGDDMRIEYLSDTCGVVVNYHGSAAIDPQDPYVRLATTLVAAAGRAVRQYLCGRRGKWDASQDLGYRQGVLFRALLAYRWMLGRDAGCCLLTFAEICEGLGVDEQRMRAMMLDRWGREHGQRLQILEDLSGKYDRRLARR